MCGKLMQYCQATAKLGHRLRKQMVLREEDSRIIRLCDPCSNMSEPSFVILIWIDQIET